MPRPPRQARDDSDPVGGAKKQRPAALSGRLALHLTSWVCEMRGSLRSSQTHVLWHPPEGTNLFYAAACEPGRRMGRLPKSSTAATLRRTASMTGWRLAANRATPASQVF